MQKRLLCSLLLILTALSLSAAEGTTHPAFTATVVREAGKLPSVHVRASNEVGRIREARLQVLCYDAKGAKISEKSVRLVRRDPNRPWVSILRFPADVAARIDHVRLVPVTAKMAPPNDITPASGCLLFCSQARYDCNDFCWTDGSTVSVFDCPNDGPVCSAYCRCADGAEAYY